MARPPESNRAYLSPLDGAAELAATYGPAAFILCLPLEFTSVYLRQQLSRFVLVVVALAFLYLLLKGRRVIAVPRMASVVLLAAYVVASLASWLLTRASGSFTSVLDITLYPIVALLLANLVLTQEDHRRAWNTFLVSALAIAMLGVFLYVTQLSIWTPNRLVAARLNITFADPNITARFLTLGACVAVLMYAARQSPAWLCASTAVACAVVEPLTLSRSGLGLFVVTLALAVIVAKERRRAVALATISLTIFVVATIVNPATRQRAEDATATVVSAVTGKPFSFGPTQSAGGHGQNAAEDNRVYLVRAGLSMFADHPAAGIGFGGYQNALTTSYRGILPPALSGANLDTLSHASLVTVLAEQGVIGTALLLAFLVALGLEAWRARRRLGVWAIWATVPASLAVPIFLYSQIEGRFFSEPYLWLALGLFYSARQAAVRDKRSARTDEALAQVA